MTDFLFKKLKTTEVAEIIGAKKHNVEKWISRGYFGFRERNSIGRGVPRYWSFSDGLRLNLFAAVAEKFGPAIAQQLDGFGQSEKAEITIPASGGDITVSLDRTQFAKKLLSMWPMDK